MFNAKAKIHDILVLHGFQIYTMLANKYSDCSSIEDIFNANLEPIFRRTMDKKIIGILKQYFILNEWLEHELNNVPIQF